MNAGIFDYDPETFPQATVVLAWPESLRMDAGPSRPGPARRLRTSDIDWAQVEELQPKPPFPDHL